MAQVIIGGEAITVSLPNFVKIEGAWTFIEQVIGGGGDPMKSVRAVLGVIAVGSEPDDVEPEALTPEAMAPKIAGLAKRLKASEMKALRNFVNPLLVEIGLGGDPDSAAGEAAPAEEGAESLSPAISEP